MLKVEFVGQAQLRYGDESVERPCWHLIDLAGGCIAEIFDASPGHFELWHEGVMWEGTDVADCVRKFTIARDIAPADFIHSEATKGDGLEVAPVREEGGNCERCEETMPPCGAFTFIDPTVALCASPTGILPSRQCDMQTNCSPPILTWRITASTEQSPHNDDDRTTSPDR